MAQDIAQLVGEAARLIKDSQHIVALTGAGVSTPSGIPDFRSPDSGVWQEVDPMEVASIYAFKHNPQAFYDWIRPVLHLIVTAQPNSAHLALAHLETHHRLNAIITQNIDMLHTKAGSKTIYEVHGNLREATCIDCYQVYQTLDFIPHFLTTGEVPTCPQCGGILKPNIILFGEMLPVRILNQARLQARVCDLMLVMGSSLEVAPAGDLPLVAKQTGAKLVIVNLSETHMDEVADVIIRADVVEVMPELVNYFMFS